MQDATRAVRCLTILGRLTGSDLLLTLWPVVLRIARLVSAFRRQTVSPDDMFRFEKELEALLREVGRLIIEWTVNRLEPAECDEMPQLFLWDGEYYRRRRKSPARIMNCLFGRITLQRYCYQSFETMGRCLFPLELQLGIVAGVATPALADFVGPVVPKLP